LVLHTSGVHGVEGFAGSAIQCYVLQTILANNNKENENHKERPHVILIHSMNPYGMAFNRRFNGDNIDLNRNALFKDDDWENVKSRHPNQFGYDDFQKLINPKREPSFWNDEIGFWFQAIYYSLRYSAKTIKKLVITGQYHYPTGIFYGGSKLSIEHELVSKFLTKDIQNYYNIDLVNNIEVLTHIDVHTGLGPIGLDTLLCKTIEVQEISKQILPEYADYYKNHNYHRIQCVETSQGWYRDLYAYCVGGSSENYGKLFPKVNNNNLCCFTQEFGTVSQIVVFKALRQENMAFHYCQNENNKEKLRRSGENVKKAFYLYNHIGWKKSYIGTWNECFLGSL